MGHIIRVLVALSLCAFLGCSAPKVDASSTESMKASIQKVRVGLPEEKRKELDEAIQILIFGELSFADILSVGKNEDKMFETIGKSLNGKTARQIIKEADQIRLERKEKERQEALEEIRELETKQVSAQQALAALSHFQVLRSSFHLEEASFLGPDPIIELTVRNDTQHAVSRAYFEGTIASPNRSVPWFRDTFNYSIPGGLEPGERGSWRLKPNTFSGWGKVDAPDDAVFTVTVQRIDGANEKTLFDATDFTESDQKRLNELKASIGE